MSDIRTLSDFLEQTGNPYRIFDLGRRIVKIDARDFARFENNVLPYPYPLQHHAWIGILSWSAQRPDEHFIWFLKLPLDEQAGLIYAARDDFVHRLLQTLGAARNADATPPELMDAMRDSPYGFTPNPERMAVFHAKAARLMGRPASKYFAHARRYLAGAIGFDQWAFVGMQGIADVIERLDEDDHASVLRQALPRLPDAPFEAVAKCLENVPIDTALGETLAEHLHALLARENSAPLRISAAIRALSFATAAGLRRDALRAVLQSPYAAQLDVLVTLSGRCWEDLADPELCHAFLEALAHHPHGNAIFTQIVSDLLYIPGMRPPVMAQLRNPQRSAALAAAIGEMFKTLGPIAI